MATILHQPEAESSTPTEKGSSQLKTLVLSVNGSAEEAKCEDLEKIVMGDDPEKLFQVGA